MEYRELLVQLDDSKECAARLRVAADLAERFDAHLVGLYADPAFDWPLPLEGVPSAALIDVMKGERQARRAATKATFEQVVGRREPAVEWREATGYPADVLSLAGRYVDLLVLGQPNPDDPRRRAADVPDSVLMDAGGPVLVVPYIGTSRPVGRRVLVAWSATRESARAVRDAMPLLRTADQVTVLAVDPTSPQYGDLPGADIAAHLARHGVRAEAATAVSSNVPIGALLLSRCAELDADLIVAGAYGHARLRELVMGGVTRELIKSMTVPVLFSH